MRYNTLWMSFLYHNKNYDDNFFTTSKFIKMNNDSSSTLPTLTQHTHTKYLPEYSGTIYILNKKKQH